MSFEEMDSIVFSHQKILEMLENISDNNDKDKIIQDFIKSCKTTPIVDFPKGLEWFNVSEPLSFTKHLKGKLVLLDFFTYCCINCMHVLPDLKCIEEEFSIENGLVVIGVHSAKFDNEKISSNILSAVQRYNISHPVVNDSENFVWNSCGVNCWPTLLLLGPEGNPIIMLMGEGHKESLQLYIRNALSYYKTQKAISNHKLPIKSSFHLLPQLKGPLLFPSKITSYVDVDNNNLEQLAIADTGNHRILVITPDGVILHQIGGICGFKDGNFENARFNSPQGLVFQNEHTLFVADTENHAIRKINLKQKTVETVAGTGKQGIDHLGGKNGKEQEISSPWDLCIYRTPDMDMSFHLPNEKVEEKDVLLIAMAGTHQIWALFLDDTVWWKFKRHSKDSCVCIVGSGREENRNNAYPSTAAFAQPSGLALNKEKKELYVADSESSSIRRVSLVDGRVTPVVGGEKSPTNLFGFGDIDGKLHAAKLQHPIGLAMSKDNILYVADTYNHKLKIIDTVENTITTLKLSNNEDKNNTFNEPCGLCFSSDGNKLFVCDTNNHIIKIVHNVKNPKSVKITKLDLRLNDEQKPIVNKFSNTILSKKNININSSGGKIILSVDLKFLDGFKLTVDAPHRWLVILPNATWSCVPNNGNISGPFETIISVPKVDVETPYKFYLECKCIVCKDDLCVPKYFVIEFDVKAVEKGDDQFYLALQIEVGSGVPRLLQ